MPAPSTLVTFTDADGDEFPVRIYGSPATHSERKVLQELTARDYLRRFIEADELRPTMPVKVTKVEGLNA
jgi:hypothetical protein